MGLRLTCLQVLWPYACTNISQLNCRKEDFGGGNQSEPTGGRLMSAYCWSWQCECISMPSSLCFFCLSVLRFLRTSCHTSTDGRQACLSLQTQGIYGQALSLRKVLKEHFDAVGSVSRTRAPASIRPGLEPQPVWYVILAAFHEENGTSVATGTVTGPRAWRFRAVAEASRVCYESCCRF